MAGTASGAPAVETNPALSALHRFFETSLYLLLLTGLLMIISTGKMDPFTSGVALVALLAKGWRGRRGLPPEISESAARRLTIGYLFFFPVDFAFISMKLAEGSQNVPLFAALLAVIHLLAFAMIVRLYSARTTRDYLFLAMVSFAMVLVSAILTIETAFLAFLVTFLLLCISTFMGLELRRAAEGAASPPLATGTPAAKRLNRALGLTTAGLCLGAVLFGGIIFLMLPRITAGFLSSYNFQPTLLSGFSDGETRLGQIGSLKQSPAVVMRVKPLAGPIGYEYWRGNAFTSFDGARWYTPSHSARIESPYEMGWYSLWSQEMDLVPYDRERMRAIAEIRERLKAWPRVATYRVFLEPIGSDKVFMATRGSAVRGTFAPGADRAGQPRASFLHVDVAGSVSNPARNFARLVYEARSVKWPYPAEILRSAGRDLSPDIRSWYLQLPPLDPRIAELAKRVTANAPTQYDKVVALEQHLRTQYMYSLEMTGASLADFLFTKKAGHCEYFATAMAVMLRTLDIPTRYARGFLGGEFNDVGGDWIVRARDAHSWVEVYFPDVGWVTFDPTPAAPTGVRGFLYRLSLYWDAAELMWIDWVVNYNFQQQNVLGQNLRRETTRWNIRLRDWVAAQYHGVVWQMVRLRQEMILLARDAPGSLGIVLLGFAAAMLYLWKRRTILQWLALRMGVRLSQKQQARLVSIYYRQMLKLLARRGIEKLPGQTAREFAAQLRATPQGTAFIEPVTQATEIFERARYGGDVSAVPKFTRLLDAIRAARG